MVLDKFYQICLSLLIYFIHGCHSETCLLYHNSYFNSYYTNCEHGCCGAGIGRYCCSAPIGINIGTIAGSSIGGIMFIFSLVCIICICWNASHRRSRVVTTTTITPNPIQVATTNVQTTSFNQPAPQTISYNQPGQQTINYNQPPPPPVFNPYPPPGAPPPYGHAGPLQPAYPPPTTPGMMFPPPPNPVYPPQKT